MDERNPILERAYTLDGDPDETRSFYADWARDYDRDTVEGFGYVAPGIAAEALARKVGPHARILDAGCGTGLVGAELSERVGTIDGLDLSPQMLAEAEAKGVYETLAEADMTRPLDLAADAYDGVISVGVFTSGHVGPEGLDELVRVARPGAPVVVTVHEKVWDRDGYPAHLGRMKAAGTLATLEVEEAPYHEREGYTCRLCVMTKAA